MESRRSTICVGKERRRKKKKRGILRSFVSFCFLQHIKKKKAKGNNTWIRNQTPGLSSREELFTKPRYSISKHQELTCKRGNTKDTKLLLFLLNLGSANAYNRRFPCTMQLITSPIHYVHIQTQPWQLW